MRHLPAEMQLHLLTLVGPGGVGRTRLALRVAEEAAQEFEAEVYFVELAHILSGLRRVRPLAEAVTLVPRKDPYPLDVG